MELPPNTVDRRRYRRYESDQVPAEMWLIQRCGSALKMECCAVVNTCFGGICFRTEQPLAMNADYDFLVHLPAFDAIVLVKAHIRWIQYSDSAAGQDKTVGAEFIESSKGYLGPE